MAYFTDFTSDNIGQPDKYTVKASCSRITVREKDLTVATLARFNVYFPSSGNYFQFRGGDPFVFQPGYHLAYGEQPFSIETVNVASTVFTVMEE